MKHDRETRLAIINVAAADGRYDEDAYDFVLSSVEATLEMIGEKRHVSGAELLEGVRMLATAQFGPMAKEVLNHWGVYTTRDIGNIVFGLIEAGLLEGSEDDSPVDFDAVYDFRTVFEEDYFRT